MKHFDTQLAIAAMEFSGIGYNPSPFVIHDLRQRFPELSSFFDHVERLQDDLRDAEEGREAETNGLQDEIDKLEDEIDGLRTDVTNAKEMLSNIIELGTCNAADFEDIREAYDTLRNA